MYDFGIPVREQELRMAVSEVQIRAECKPALV